MQPLVVYTLDFAADAELDACIHEVAPGDGILTATDLAATRGDGVFETILVVDGVPQALDAHLDRFTRSALLLDLPAPRRELWARAIDRAARTMHGAAPRTAVKFILSRGDEAGDGFPTGWAVGFAPSSRPDGAIPQLDVVLLDRGYRHDVAQTSPWLLQGAKTLSYAINMAALREARRRGAHDAIFVSLDGFVLEGPNSTVVARYGDAFVTPPVEFGILPGTTQGDVFAALADWGHPVSKRRLTVDELADADALWLCSSTRGAAPVRSVDGVPRPVDDHLTDRLNDALDARKA